MSLALAPDRTAYYLLPTTYSLLPRTRTGQDFLLRTVPYLIDNPELGFVQGRWTYINQAGPNPNPNPDPNLSPNPP